MTEAQQAALERLRNAGDGTWYPGIGLDYLAVAALCLAEHAADDAEPVTEDWAIQHSGTSGTHGDVWMKLDEQYLHWRARSGEVVLQPNQTQRMCGVMRIKNATRGDVSRLCAALGVPLQPRDQQEPT